MERSKDLFSLHGKVSIVTGGGRGLGNGIALALAGAGSDLVLAARSTHELERISQKIITDTKRKVFPLSLDLTKEGEIERLITSVLDEFGRIDVLVNNAGIELPKKVTDTTEPEWDRLMDVNLKGVFLCSRAVIPLMQRREEEQS